ncbi:MAG: hypothetical protein U1C66_01525, partial [Patescibacteria group bacterium]|nr:hypothetical protein [Patescibacteria group bacterium]
MKFKKLLLLVQRVVLSPAAFWRYVVHYARLYQYNDLLQFAGEEGSDKGSPGHNYVRVYDAFLRDRRDSVTHLCEIGLLRLGVQKQAPAEVYPKAPSLNMWRKYLPHTHLVGFD